MKLMRNKTLWVAALLGCVLSSLPISSRAADYMEGSFPAAQQEAAKVGKQLRKRGWRRAPASRTVPASPETDFQKFYLQQLHKRCRNADSGNLKQREDYDFNGDRRKEIVTLGGCNSSWLDLNVYGVQDNGGYKELPLSMEFNGKSIFDRPQNCVNDLKIHSFKIDNGLILAMMDIFGERSTPRGEDLGAGTVATARREIAFRYDGTQFIVASMQDIPY